MPNVRPRGSYILHTDAIILPILSRGLRLATHGKWIKNNDIQYLFNNREEHKLTIIMSFKYSMGFDVEMRNKYDYVFLLPSSAKCKT